jgi:hypothetical protein
VKHQIPFDPTTERREDRAVSRSAFRWVERGRDVSWAGSRQPRERVLQQRWTIITYQSGTGYGAFEVDRRDEWRDVPTVREDSDQPNDRGDGSLGEPT